MHSSPFAFGFFALLGLANPALALESCPIRVEPSAAESDWGREAARVRAKLGELPSSEQDCREILVRVEGAGRRANVVLTTGDARTATRPVQGPDDLESVISALIVTVPAADDTSARRPSEAHAPERDTTAAEPGRASSKTNRYWLALALAGGGRASASAALVAPTFGGSVAGRVGRFETGLFGQHEPRYVVASGSVPQGFALRATAFGAFTGYRHPLAGIALIGGVRAGAALVHEQAQVPADQIEGTDEGNTEVDDDLLVTQSMSPVEARLGGYVGLVVPARSRVGFRTELALEGVPVRFNDTPPASSMLPALPNWAASIQIGLEGGVL